MTTKADAQATTVTETATSTRQVGVWPVGVGVVGAWLVGAGLVGVWPAGVWGGVAVTDQLCVSALAVTSGYIATLG